MQERRFQSCGSPAHALRRGDAWHARGMHTANIATTYRFARCEVDDARRELRVDGQPRALQPLAFDLLCYLIRHRDRVVPKQELIHAVWGEAGATSGALARTVMKVRHAIEDADGAEARLRTVHRIGYRFQGPVVSSEHALAVTPPRRARDDTPCIAVLPTVNATGDPNLDWVGLAGMSMLSAVVDRAAGFHALPTDEVLRAVRLDPAPSAVEQHLRERHGPMWRIGSRLAPDLGRLLLHYRLDDGGERLLEGTVCGSTPVEAAGRACAHFERWLHDARRDALPRAVSRQIGACATAAIASGRYEDALQVLKAMGRERAGDDGWAATAERLALSALGRWPSAPVGGAALDDLGGAWIHALNGRWTEASRHADACVNRGLSGGDGGAVAPALLESVRWRMAAHPATAAPALSQLLAVAERLGDRQLLCEAWTLAGECALAAGDGSSASWRLAQAMTLVEPDRPQGQALAQAWTGLSQLQQGRLTEADTASSSGFDAAHRSGGAWVRFVAAVVRLEVLAATRHGHALLALSERTASHAQAAAAAPLLEAAHALQRHRLLRWAGRWTEALLAAAQARRLARGHWLVRRGLDLSWWQTLLAARRFDELRQALERHPRDCGATVAIEWMAALADHLQHGRTEEAVDRLHRALPAVVTHDHDAALVLDLAWLHLERGRPEAAAALHARLPANHPVLPAAALVEARLRHALGDAPAAVRLQRRHLATVPDTASPIEHQLLALYEQRPPGARLPALDTALHAVGTFDPALVPPSVSRTSAP